MIGLLRNRFLKAIGVLLLLGGVYVGIYQFTTGNTKKLIESDQPELAWLKQEFSLNDVQFEKIKSIHMEFDVECHEMCQDLAESQEKLHLLIAQNSTITPEIKASLSETAAFREFCRQSTLRHLYRISALMTPEQAAQYREAMSKSVMTTGRVPHLNDPGELHDHILHHHTIEAPGTHD